MCIRDRRNWFLDFGALKHMTIKKDWFITFIEAKSKIETTVFGFGWVHFVENCGDVQMKLLDVKKCTFENVHYIPLIRYR